MILDIYSFILVILFIVLCSCIAGSKQKHLKNDNYFHVDYLEGKHARHSLIQFKSTCVRGSHVGLLLYNITVVLISVHYYVNLVAYV